MAEESEKRFHSIMDKLFHAPPPPPPPKSTKHSSISSSSSSSSLSGVQLSRGRKHLNLTSTLSAMDSKSRGDIAPSQNSIVADKSLQQDPVCRPWDRGDLLKRLATFKSMTWFGKPKVVSAVNCARRGWVNVDMDIIACEACGARLLFSTPSSWSQQQVEKAALVFSLKLDNGHKLLCPWIDNTCDEKLAQFPPMPAPVLVDGYRARSSALLQLLALPVISSSAIDSIRSPHLEHLLRQSFPLEKYLGNDCEAVSANLYYQALKLISLNGWEPRSLPYLVDCKNQTNQSTKDATHSNSTHMITNGRESCIRVYSAFTSKIMETTKGPKASAGLQLDHHSVVLDCSLCGASVGLWAFSSVPRPVELFRLVGFTDVSGENDSEATGSQTRDSSSSGNHGDSAQGVLNATSNGASSSRDRLSTLNMTIAGGPPPTKQNFKATISLPIIGQNLRARFSSDLSFRDQVGVNIHSESGNKNIVQEGNEHVENTHTRQVQPEGVGLLKRKRHDDGHCSPTNDGHNNNIIEIEDTFTKEANNQTSMDNRSVSGQGLFPETVTPDLVMGNAIESFRNLAQEPAQNVELSQNEENAGAVDPAVGVSGEYLTRDSSITILGANCTIRHGDTTENDSSVAVAADGCSLQTVMGNGMIHSKEISLASHQESSCVASCMEAIVNVDNTSKIDLREGNSGVLNTQGKQTNSKESDVVEDRARIPVNNEVACGIVKDLKKLPIDKAMEFDPIRQHRHFCPWISSTGSGAPGWQQTLLALQRQKECSNPLPTESPSSASVIKVDDPVASVRNLFMSPSAKRTKSAHKP